MNELPVPTATPAYHGMQADEICDVSGVLELSGGGGIHSLVVLDILRFDSDNKGTGYIVAAHVSWVQADKICDVLGVLELSGGCGIHSLVVPHILRFDSDNKGTGYIVTARISWDASRRDL